jgi:hypothetical protein
MALLRPYIQGQQPQWTGVLACAHAASEFFFFIEEHHTSSAQLRLLTCFTSC